MRCGGGAVVKDEADIIEAFIRHNLAYLDYLQVVDNASTDGTWEILTSLAAEGLPLYLSRDYRLDHPQADLMSAMLHQPAEPTDWFFCLDADEFIDCASVAAFAAAVEHFPADWVVLVSWEYFVPTVNDDSGIANPIERINHRRVSPADPWLAKVVVPSRFLGQPELRVRAGNHLLEQRNGVTLRARPVDTVHLAHFPVRSAQQIARKVITGSWAISARNRRNKGEGSHRSAMKERALSGQAFTGDELTQLATEYASEPSEERARIVRRPLAPAGGELRYTVDPDAAEAPLRSAVSYADAHFERLRATALQSGNVRIGKTRYGLLAFHVNEDAQARDLAAFGEWVAPEIDLLLGFLVAGDVVVDIGAGIGTHTVAFSQRVGPGGRVVAFEPDSGRRQLLNTNLTLNCDDNVVIANRGFVDCDIEACDLAGLALVRLATPHPVEVLNHAAATVVGHSPTIFVEDVSPVDSAAPLAWLDERGYRCWWLVNPRFNPDNFYEQPPGPDSEFGAPRLNLLALPAGVEAPGGLVPARAPVESWQSVWEEQGARTYEVPPRWGRPPLGLDPKWQ